MGEVDYPSREALKDSRFLRGQGRNKQVFEKTRNWEKQSALEGVHGHQGGFGLPSEWGVQRQGLGALGGSFPAPLPTQIPSVTASGACLSLCPASWPLPVTSAASQVFCCWKEGVRGWWTGTSWPLGRSGLRCQQIQWALTSPLGLGDHQGTGS